MIHKVCFFGQKKMRFLQIESVLQTKNRSEQAKNWFSVALFGIMNQYDPTFDLKVIVGHYDLYFMVQWFCVIS